MKKLSLAALIAVSLALMPAISAMAGTVSIPKKSPLVTLTIPDNWEPTDEDQGVSAESPDKAVSIFFEIASKKGTEALIDENIDWLAKTNEVKIDPATQKEQEVEIGGIKWNRISWDGSSKEFGASVVGFLFTDLGEGKILTVTYWITKKDAEKNMPALEKIFASMKASE